MDCYTIIIFQQPDMETFICPLVHCAFSCHGNADKENIYNGWRTNAAAEASYDRARYFF